MARFEGNFAATGVPLEGGDLRQLLEAFAASRGSEREAIACYLSAAEGWDEALKALCGAFASDAAEAVRSSGAKAYDREINQRASEYLQWPALKAAGTDND